MKKVLVTGGCGFIGSNFIKYLLTNPEINNNEISILNVDKQTYAGKGENIEHMNLHNHRNYKFFKIDICDKNAIFNLFEQENPDIIFNFAAESHVDRSIINSENFINTNVIGTFNLLEASKKYPIQKFVQISTDEVYGSIREGSFNENSVLNPSSPYSSSKAAAELQAISYFKTHEVPVVITRSANNYGPYQFPEKFLPLFITNLIEGKKVPLMWSEENPGLNVRDWLHVEDNCRAIWFLSQYGREGEFYNISGEKERTNLEVTGLLLENTGYDKEMIEYIKHRKGHDFRYSISGEKLRSLGFKCKHLDFENEIKEVIKWYKENPEWWGKLKNKTDSIEKEIIEGVKIKKLKVNKDYRGDFREVIRTDGKMIGEIKQVSIGKTKSGIIKAFHWHKYQDDLFYLLKGKIKLVLYDARENSITKGRTQVIILEKEQEPKTVFIPQGIYHGYQVLGDKEAEVLYMMNKTYNSLNPDEERVSFDDPIVDFDWGDKKQEKVLIIGASGNLGRYLMKSFSKDFKVIGTYNTNKEEGLIPLDITKKEEVESVFEKEKPDIILLCSAMTNVEQCELEPEKAFNINVNGVKNVVDLCRNRKLVFLSTDAVFDGTKEEYKEEDIPNPINVYGKTKLQGEELVKTLPDWIICRTCRLYGLRGKKFINNVIDSLKEGREIKVPVDNPGNPSFIEDVSKSVLELVKREKTGIWHVAGEENSLDETVFAIAKVFEFDNSLINLVDKNFFNTTVKRTSVVLNTDKLKNEGIFMELLESVLQKIKDFLDNFTEVNQCRICGSRNLIPHLDLGDMPLVNNLIEPGEESLEKKYPLKVMFCMDCFFSQLSGVVNPEILFRHYTYRSSISDSFGQHCKELAEELNSNLIQGGDLVLDIASNDGYLLKYFKDKGNRVLGVDPAVNLARIANDSGIETLPEFWNENLAEKILEKYGHAKVITAFNVFAHVQDIHSFVKGVKKLLHKDGYFIIEVPHLLNLVKKRQFDTIYHEHLSYFLVKPLVNFIRQHGMRIAKVKEKNIHGGSIRLYIEHSEKQDTSDDSTQRVIQKEEAEGLYDIKTYINLKEDIEKIKKNLKSKLVELKNQGKKVAAFGASAKGCILLNSAQIGKDLLECIFDDTIEKQGKLASGTHISILSREKISEINPDFLLLLAWNFADEMMEKTKEFKEKGGKYIIPVPDLTII